MNKSLISKILIFIIIIIIPYNVFAENFKPAIIGILDIQRIKKESKAIISIRDQITGERLKYEKKFRSKEEILRKEEQEKMEAIINALIVGGGTTGLALRPRKIA